MKKIIFTYLAIILMTSSVFAECNCAKSQCEEKKPCSIENPNDCTLDRNLVKEGCDKCSVEDDEYCVYNQCYFDKQFRKMKKALCLTKQQEYKIDGLYKCFKNDMENFHARYRNQKNKVLAMIECNNKCYKDEVKELKEIKKDIKERAKQFKYDVKNELCKEQYSAFRKFQREEKSKMKKLAKYSKVYKLPCKNCCK